MYIVGDKVYFFIDKLEYQEIIDTRIQKDKSILFIVSDGLPVFNQNILGKTLVESLATAKKELVKLIGEKNKLGLTDYKAFALTLKSLGDYTNEQIETAIVNLASIQMNKIANLEMNVNYQVHIIEEIEKEILKEKEKNNE